MDSTEKDNLKAFLIELYGNQANAWPMNNRIFNLTYKLISDSSVSLDAIEYVPRPMPPGRAPIDWMSKAVRSKFLRKLNEKKGYYSICAKRAAYHMASEFQLAAAGL